MRLWAWKQPDKQYCDWQSERPARSGRRSLARIERSLCPTTHHTPKRLAPSFPTSNVLDRCCLGVSIWTSFDSRKAHNFSLSHVRDVRCGSAGSGQVSALAVSVPSLTPGAPVNHAMGSTGGCSLRLDNARANADSSGRPGGRAATFRNIPSSLRTIPREEADRRLG